MRRLRRFSIALVVAALPLLISASPAMANNPPVCEDRSYTVTSGVSFQLPLNSCTDPDGPGGISYSLASSPSHGTVSPTAAYTSDPGYTGPDSFTYRGTDGAGAQSAIATVSITVEPAPPNDPPSCPGGGPFTTGSAVAVELPACTDDEAFALQYEGFADNGSFLIRDGLPYYRSQLGYTGPATVTYRARDRFGVDLRRWMSRSSSTPRCRRTSPLPAPTQRSSCRSGSPWFFAATAPMSTATRSATTSANCRPLGRCRSSASPASATRPTGRHSPTPLPTVRPTAFMGSRA